MTALGAPEPLLLWRAAGRLCALPLGSVIETMRPLPTTAVDGTPPFVVGVAMVRGRATPVVDAAALLGTPGEPASRWLTLRVGSRAVALAVSEVVGVEARGGERQQTLPPLLEAAAHASLQALATRDAELLHVLDGARMLDDAAWASLPSEAPPR